MQEQGMARRGGPAGRLHTSCWHRVDSTAICPVKYQENGRKKGFYAMRNSTRYVAIIVIGIIALVVGVLFQVQVLGYYPTRAIVLIAVGVILLIFGIVGMMVMRNRSRL